MLKTIKFALGFMFTLSFCSAQAEVSLIAARIGAVDVHALTEFYKSAFGLKEVNRLDLPGGHVEFMLNFGDTTEAALSNSNAQIVIMHRESDEIPDSVPHLMFGVTDIDATTKAIVSAGGTLLREPFSFGDTKLAFLQDPAGNQMELIQRP